MIRIIIGATAAAFAMFIIGFLFFATPLIGIGTATLDNDQAAAVQQTLAANLPRSGTYFVPGTATPEQTVMYGQGPIATIHYNIHGFQASDSGAILQRLVMNFVVALLICAALVGIDRRVTDFASRARLVAIFAAAAAAYMHLGEPIWYHHEWAHFVYLFIGDTIAFSVGGIVIARWFLSPTNAPPANVPTDV